MRDLRSAGEMSRGQANGDKERGEAGTGEEKSPAGILFFSLVSRMRGAIDAIRDAQDDEAQL